MRRRGLTRREILQGGGVAVVGAGGLTLAGLAGYAWPHDKAAAATINIGTAPATPNDAHGTLHFVSRPDLTPPALTIARHGPASPDPAFFVLSPAAFPEPGPCTPG